jgi:hypothetical protein
MKGKMFERSRLSWIDDPLDQALTAILVAASIPHGLPHRARLVVATDAPDDLSRPGRGALRAGKELIMRKHRYAVGQHESYAEDHPPKDMRRGGYEIVVVHPAADWQPQDQIRRADLTHARVGWESRLQADPGARERCG